jgi:hypothetical protein
VLANSWIPIIVHQTIRTKTDLDCLICLCFNFFKIIFLSQRKPIVVGIVVETLQTTARLKESVNANMGTINTLQLLHSNPTKEPEKQHSSSILRGLGRNKIHQK